MNDTKTHKAPNPPDDLFARIVQAREAECRHRRDLVNSQVERYVLERRAAERGAA